MAWVFWINENIHEKNTAHPESNDSSGKERASGQIKPTHTLLFRIYAPLPFGRGAEGWGKWRIDKIKRQPKDQIWEESCIIFTSLLHYPLRLAKQVSPQPGDSRGAGFVTQMEWVRWQIRFRARA